jgi:ABC-2 type transport system permease protein
MSMVNPVRLLALCRKESYQIVRDPSSILVAFILPVILLFVIGYAINLDSDHMRIGLLVEDRGAEAVSFKNALCASKAFDVHIGTSRDELMGRMDQGELRGLVVVENDFTAKLKQGGGNPSIQLLTDGTEPNTANFIATYIQGAFGIWQQELAADAGMHRAPKVDVIVRTWFNPSNISHNFIVPGSIAVVMTIVGALLTSLVVAREWERGTMEALLATPVTKTELLASKVIPYYVLGIMATAICLIVSVFIMGVPFRGSVLTLFVISTMFLGAALGNGLFLSTIMRSQFNAASAALISAFLPAQLLSGVVFEIKSMPKLLQIAAHVIPAKYYVNSLQTLFQTGFVGPLLLENVLGLGALAILWLGLTAKNTTRTLD